MAKDISIIGGADGPTSIFLVGKLGDGTLIGIVVIAIVIVVAIVAFLKRKKK